MVDSVEIETHHDVVKRDACLLRGRGVVDSVEIETLQKLCRTSKDNRGRGVVDSVEIETE